MTYLSTNTAVLRFIKLGAFYAFVGRKFVQDHSPLGYINRGILEEILDKNLSKVSKYRALHYYVLTSLNSRPLLSYNVL